MEQSKEQNDKSMTVIRKHCEHGERSNEEEAISNGSWKEFSQVQDDCNIEEDWLDESKLMIHTGKYKTHWLTGKLALMIKTFMTMSMK